MYYEWHNKYLNKENSLFLTILNYFRQILVAFKYFVQLEWWIIVKNLELPYNVILKTKVVTDSSVRVLSGIRAAQSSVFCVFFIDHYLSFCPFSFGHCIVCPSSILAFTNFSYLLTYTCTTMLSQLSNLFHCKGPCNCNLQRGGAMGFFSFRIFFPDNTRVRIFIFIVANFFSRIYH